MVPMGPLQISMFSDSVVNTVKLHCQLLQHDGT